MLQPMCSRRRGLANQAMTISSRYKIITSNEIIPPSARPQRLHAPAFCLEEETRSTLEAADVEVLATKFSSFKNHNDEKSLMKRVIISSRFLVKALKVTEDYTQAAEQKTMLSHRAHLLERRSDRTVELLETSKS